MKGVLSKMWLFSRKWKEMKNWLLKTAVKHNSNQLNMQQNWIASGEIKYLSIKDIYRRFKYYSHYMEIPSLMEGE